MIDYWLNLTIWKKIKFIFVLIGVIFLIFFCVINSQPTEVNFIFGKIKISLVLLIFLSLVIGYALSSIVDYRKFILKNNEIKKLKYKLDELKKSIPTPEIVENEKTDLKPQ